LLPITSNPQATAPMRKAPRQTRAKRHSSGSGEPRRQANAIANGASSSNPSEGIKLKKRTARVAFTILVRLPLSSADFIDS
jgi:hypothetical protein